jgi:predicted nucleic acid-binding protein
MAVFFLDTSAAAKRYVQETGSAWITALTDLAAGNRCWITTVTPVEITALLHRRRRMGILTTAQVQQVEQVFDQELSTLYQVLTVTPSILQWARELVARHPLRAYDAVQLAAALFLKGQHDQLGLPAPIFLSADQDLNSAGTAERLQVDDPNQHP